MTNYYLLLSLFACLLVTSCADDAPISFSTTSPPQWTLEVRVLDYQGDPVRNTSIMYGLNNGRTFATSKKTDHDGYIKVYVSRYVTKDDLLDGGFIQALPKQEFPGGYIYLSSIDGIQTLQAPEKEEINVEFLNAIDHASLNEGKEQDVSIKVTSTTRLPFNYIFNAATAIDGEFRTVNGFSNYDCPPTDNDGRVNLTFVKTGDEPSMQITLNRHDESSYNYEMSLMEQ